MPEYAVPGALQPVAPEQRTSPMSAEAEADGGMYKKQGQGSSLTWKKGPAPSLMAMPFQRMLFCIYRQTHT